MPKSAMAFKKDSATRPRNTRPKLQRHKVSTAHDTTLRETIRPWADLSATPPGCRAVSSSSWTRFTPESKRNTTRDLKASILCAGKGTTHDFNPPLLERVYLGTDQPQACERPEVRRDQRRRTQRWPVSSTSSWSTVGSHSSVTTASTGDKEASSEPITFRKMEIKASPSPPSSLLTANIRGSLPQVRESRKPCITEEMAREYGVTVLSSSHLPESCFDDSDDDE